MNFPDFVEMQTSWRHSHAELFSVPEPSTSIYLKRIRIFRVRGFVQRLSDAARSTGSESRRTELSDHVFSRFALTWAKRLIGCVASSFQFEAKRATFKMSKTFLSEVSPVIDIQILHVQVACIP